MKKSNQNGQSLLFVTVMVFIFITYSLLVTSAVLRSNKVRKVREAKEIDLWAAEAGVEKALYCMNNQDPGNCGGTSGDTYAGETAVQIDDATFTTLVTSIDSSNFELLSTGNYLGSKRTIKRLIERDFLTLPIQISQAVFADDGGILFDGNPKVTGDILSNGDVNCGGKEIEGSVTISGEHTLIDCIVTGEARANTIQDSTIEGDAYYQTIINSTVLGTLYPGTADTPIIDSIMTDLMIGQWKAEAALGTTINGDFTVSSAINMGPIVITGNLIVESNSPLTMTGTVYVQGDIIIEGNADIFLHEDFGELSGIVITDGILTVGSATRFNGTSLGGVLTFLSTSTANPAIDFTSGTPSGGIQVSICAPNGTVIVGTGAKLLNVCGKNVLLVGGATLTATGTVTEINYLSDVTELTFWNIKEGGLNE